MATPPYRFYGTDVSYFSGKVRPALRYKQVPYEEIQPSPEAYRDVIIPRTGLAFIPVVITPDDVVLQDTSEILDALEDRFPDATIFPQTPAQQVIAYLIEVYADEFMVLPAMHYRWSFPESEAKARRDFAAVTGNDDAAGRFADRMKGSISFLGVLPDTHKAIEAHLAELLEALELHFGKHDYLLGSRMSLADCALMGPLYAHLYLDAVPGRLLRETAPAVCAWIERMNEPKPGEGRFLADDEIAETLQPFLELIGKDAAPILLDTLRDFETWADDAEVGSEPPRAVGMNTTQLRGVNFQRYTSSYSLWMLQRPLDAYAALAETERARVDSQLAGTGLESILAYTPRHRVGKRDFKLVLES